MNNNSHNNGTVEISKALIGCFGVVLAAVVTGVFLLISTGVIRFDPTPLEAQGSGSNLPGTAPGATTSSQASITATSTRDLPSPTITPTPATTIPVTPDECSPPAGLVELWYATQYQWSLGIWGTPNIADFTSALGTVDTNDPDFGEFTLWIDPCGLRHGYTDGAQFWALTHGIPSAYAPMTIGQVYVVGYIPAATGLWTLGNSR